MAGGEEADLKYFVAQLPVLFHSFKVFALNLVEVNGCVAANTGVDVST